MDNAIIEFFARPWGQWGVFNAGHILLITIELICAVIFSGVIGYEREYHGHSAGFRTHILVSLGACLIMIISINAPGFNINATRDPARLAAQVVSGIGFLGAGTIIKNGTDVKGLTTAATIWLVGAIGLACGSGYFTGAIITTLVSLITLVFLTKIEKRISKRMPRMILVVKSESAVLKDIMELSNINNVEIRDIHSRIVKSSKGESLYRFTILMSRRSLENIETFAEELRYRLSPVEFKMYNY